MQFSAGGVFWSSDEATIRRRYQSQYGEDPVSAVGCRVVSEIRHDGNQADAFGVSLCVQLMNPSPVESAIESFAWNEFVLKVATDCAAQEDAVYGAFKLSPRNAMRTAVELGFFW